ncbi:hypothetical protein HJG60_009121 [Phyllostomus discolor]|uniref:Uncharacterized protein n=1 Tax=Phyllostomus discolor TaxID=89673 RepID=A0A834DFP9_9CHIR|nr:hypothetical protein HJG60_009121 [Phyllostomus discolor]
MLHTGLVVKSRGDEEFNMEGSGTASDKCAFGTDETPVPGVLFKPGRMGTNRSREGSPGTSRFHGVSLEKLILEQDPVSMAHTISSSSRNTQPTPSPMPREAEIHVLVRQGRKFVEPLDKPQSSGRLK